MTPRERFLACMRFQPTDRPVLWEWVPWESTINRWMAEAGVSREQVLTWLGERDPEENTGVGFGMIPAFQERVVSEDKDTVTVSDRLGTIHRQFKNNPERSMPEFVAPPVKTPGDWKDIKRRFDPTTPERYPQDWNTHLARWKQHQPVLRLYGCVFNYYGGPSLFGFVRMLLGEEKVHYAFYDEPAMVHDMMETATEFAINVMSKALAEAPVTLVQFWEDMCYKSGSLLSPAMFREFMLPRYKRIADVIRRAGVDIIFVDSDGNVEQLLPLWIEAGINGVFPMEQAAGNDIHAYRKRFGRNLLMTGGIDKRALAAGPKAIDEELQRKIPLVLAGGYIPMLDHTIPPDVSYENFLYYWRRKKELLGLGK